MSFQTMLAAVRESIRDNRYNVTVGTIGCNDPNVSSCLLEIHSNGMLLTTVTGVIGNPPPVAVNLSLDLTTSSYSTIGLLGRAINALPGYVFTPEPNSESDHESVDIDVTGPVEIVRGYDLRTRLFSDSELSTLLNRVIVRHNPSFSTNSVPSGEEPLVVTLAQAEVYRILANDSSKRKDMEETVDALLKISKSYEDIYTADFKRLNRVLSAPRETTESIGSGDVMVGLLTRQSMRSGYGNPVSSQLGADSPVVWDPNGLNVIEDTNVTLYWSRKKSTYFKRLELWRDTRPNVQRSSSQITQPTTSKLVWTGRSVLQDVAQDSGLEPSMTYYYRLYLIDDSNEFMATDVLTVTTKALRVRFYPDNAGALLNQSGVPEDTVAISLTGYTNGDTVLDMDGKVLTGSWNSDFSVFLATIPSFVTRGVKSITVTSTALGMFDTLQNCFTVLGDNQALHSPFGPAYDMLLTNDPPVGVGGTTYTITRVSGLVTQEAWAITSTGFLVKTVDYIRSGSNVEQEVRRAYGVDGITITAQETVTYTRTGSTVTGATVTKDI